MAVFGIAFNSSNLYYKMLPMEEAKDLYNAAPNPQDRRYLSDSSGRITAGQSNGLPFVDSYVSNSTNIFRKNIEVEFVPGKSPTGEHMGTQHLLQEVAMGASI